MSVTDSPVVSVDGTRPVERRPEGPFGAGHAYQIYVDLFDEQRTGEVSPAAPVPVDAVERANNLKAGLYFLDADMVGCGLICDDASTKERRDHGRAPPLARLQFTQPQRQRGAAHPTGARSRPRRDEPDRRAAAQPVRRAPLQVGRAHHRHAAHPRRQDRLRAARLLPEMHQMRPRVPLRGDPVRRQDHVQRVRDMEPRRREMHQVPPRQLEGLGLRPMHEDRPLQH